MANQGNQKIKILKIMEYLQEETDENHALSAQEIIERLKQEGITAERKSIYTDINVLKDYGMDILHAKELGGYYLASRNFELPELKLLSDAVSASKFITEKKSRELVKKIEKLASRYEGKQLQRQVVVMDRVKAENEAIYYSIDVIYRCIDNDHKMTFQYSQWTPEKKEKLRHEGEIYVVSPAFLLWDNENYYLVAYSDKNQEIRHYRVDKIRNAAEKEEERSGRKERKNLKESSYAKKTFSMYAGEEKDITLQCKASLTGVLMDQFGTDITLRKTKDDQIVAHVKVEVSPQFYGWLTGLGNQIKITAPEKEAKKYKKYLKTVVENYS